MDKLDENGIPPLKRYLDEWGISPAAFAKFVSISRAAVYKIYHGTKPFRSTANRICRATGGKLTLKDFGYEY